MKNRKIPDPTAKLRNADEAGASRARGIPVVSIALLCLSALFFKIWYDRFLKWDFNELGRYYDAAEEIVYTDAGFVWAIPTVFFLIAAIPGIVRFLRARKQRNGRPAG